MVKVMPKRRLYSRTISGAISNATSETFQPKEPHDPRYVLFITTGSVEEQTNAPTAIAFGKLVNSIFIPLEEFTSNTAGIRRYIDKTHHFLPGEEPAFRFEAGTLTNVIQAYLEGYEEPI